MPDQHYHLAPVETCIRYNGGNVGDINDFLDRHNTSWFRAVDNGDGTLTIESNYSGSWVESKTIDVGGGLHLAGYNWEGRGEFFTLTRDEFNRKFVARYIED